MSWYKLNEPHLRLSGEAFGGHYTGLRVQCDTFPGLTSKGLFHAKRQLRELQGHSNGNAVKQRGCATDIITDLSLDWLKQRDRSKSFLLLGWQKAPHRNWQPALRDFDFDQDRTYALPNSLFQGSTSVGWRTAFYYHEIVLLHSPFSDFRNSSLAGLPIVEE